MNGNSIIKVGVGLAFIALLFLVVLAYYYWPVVIGGVVDHITIVGVRDGASIVVMEITPHGVVVKDEGLRSHLAGLGRFTLDDAIEFLRQRYNAVYCTVSIRLSTSDPLNNLVPGETLAYIVDVELCGILEAGSKVRFTITRLDPLKISGIIEPITSTP